MARKSETRQSRSTSVRSVPPLAPREIRNASSERLLQRHLAPGSFALAPVPWAGQTLEVSPLGFEDVNEQTARLAQTLAVAVSSGRKQSLDKAKENKHEAGSSGFDGRDRALRSGE
jgi:hypothetical protein